MSVPHHRRPGRMHSWAPWGIRPGSPAPQPRPAGKREAPQKVWSGMPVMAPVAGAARCAGGAAHGRCPSLHR
eukprot:365861-Chlamydomonas_euryale.AAC.12